jgi:hypothetical protein
VVFILNSQYIDPALRVNQDWRRIEGQHQGVEHRAGIDRQEIQQQHHQRLRRRRRLSDTPQQSGIEQDNRSAVQDQRDISNDLGVS